MSLKETYKMTNAYYRMRKPTEQKVGPTN